MIDNPTDLEMDAATEVLVQVDHEFCRDELLAIVEGLRKARAEGEARGVEAGVAKERAAVVATLDKMIGDMERDEDAENMEGAYMEERFLLTGVRNVIVVGEHVPDAGEGRGNE